MDQYEKGIPIVNAVRRPDCDGLMFFCRYCKRWHFHGMGEGHRVAHCYRVPHWRTKVHRDRPTPYDRTGYILRLEIGFPPGKHKGMPRDL